MEFSRWMFINRILIHWMVVVYTQYSSSIHAKYNNAFYLEWCCNLLAPSWVSANGFMDVVLWNLFLRNRTFRFEWISLRDCRYGQYLPCQSTYFVDLGHCYFPILTHFYAGLYCLISWCLFYLSYLWYLKKFKKGLKEI